MFNLRNLVIGLVLAVCALRGIGSVARSKVPATQRAIQDSASKGSSGSGIQLVLHKVMDTDGSGGLACTYLLPVGWTATDRVQWLVDNFTTPVVGSSVMKSADGSEEIDTSSGVATNYGHGPAGDSGTPPPSHFSQYLLAGWKKDNPGVECQVLTEEDTPVEVTEAPSPSVGRAQASRGVVKLKFKRDGHVYLSKAQARLDTFETNHVPTAIGGVLYEGGWRVSSVYVVTAPEQEFDEVMKTSAVVITSCKSDPHFYSRVLQAQKLIQARFYDMENRIRQTSELISRTNDEISDSIMSSYNSSQRATDHEAEAFDDYIRGVDKYDEPSGSSGPIDLPSGYAHAWSDNNGHYIVSDENLYDPNVANPSISGSGGNWQELEKSR